MRVDEARRRLLHRSSLAEAFELLDEGTDAGLVPLVLCRATHAAIHRYDGLPLAKGRRAEFIFRLAAREAEEAAAAAAIAAGATEGEEEKEDYAYHLHASVQHGKAKAAFERQCETGREQQEHQQRHGEDGPYHFLDEDAFQRLWMRLQIVHRAGVVIPDMEDSAGARDILVGAGFESAWEEADGDGSSGHGNGVVRRHRVWDAFRRAVRSAHFTHFFLGAVLVNTLVVLPLEHRDLVRIERRAARVELAHPLRDRSTEAAEDAHAAAIWVMFELSFSAVYVFESAAKVSVFGLRRYWRSGTNRFDAACAWLPAIAQVWALCVFGGAVAFDPQISRLVLLSRLLRLLRLFNHSSRFRTISDTLAAMLPPAASLFGTLWVLMYTYSLVGVDAFGGHVYRGNPTLVGSPFEEANYFELNFNDMLSGIVTLWCLLVVNDWAVIMDGIVLASDRGGLWRFYFMSFYVVGAVACLGVLTSFIIDRFMLAEDNRLMLRRGELQLERQIFELVGCTPPVHDDEFASAGGDEGGEEVQECSVETEEREAGEGWRVEQKASRAGMGRHGGGMRMRSLTQTSSHPSSSSSSSSTTTTTNRSADDESYDGGDDDYGGDGGRHDTTHRRLLHAKSCPAALRSQRAVKELERHLFPDVSAAPPVRKPRMLSRMSSA